MAMFFSGRVSSCTRDRKLFFSDPSGLFVRYKCKAIGSGSEGAQSNLQEGYSDSLTLAEAEVLAVSTLKQVGVVVAHGDVDPDALRVFSSFLNGLYSLVSCV